MDSCYLCEIGKEGLVVRLGDREILVCTPCTLESIYAHPKLAYLLHPSKGQ